MMKGYDEKGRPIIVCDFCEEKAVKSIHTTVMNGEYEKIIHHVFFCGNHAPALIEYGLFGEPDSFDIPEQKLLYQDDAELETLKKYRANFICAMHEALDEVFK